MVGVPFHTLAEEFFPQVDKALAGTGALYEKLDINRLVIALGDDGALRLEEPPPTEPDGDATTADPAAAVAIELSVRRCALAYTNSATRKRPLRHLAMSGDCLGDAEEYRGLIRPVLNPDAVGVTVTPLLLGFALSVADVRKVSALTDRHGNFKVWVSPSLRGFSKLFRLLAALELVAGVVSTTASVPILQSQTMKRGGA